MPAPDYALEISQLQSAMAAGELTIEANGERVTYQSFGDMKKRLDYFAGLAAAATGPASLQTKFGFSAVAFDRN